MTDADRILKAAEEAYGYDTDDGCVPTFRPVDAFVDVVWVPVRDSVRPVVVAVLRGLAKRPEDWNRYELSDMADEIEGKSDD